MNHPAYIPRTITPHISEAMNYFRVVVITGPRQSGKTSLAKHLFPDFGYVNLEDITTRAAAISDPANFMESLGERVIIDEVQNVPEILSDIQVRVDQDKTRRYILTGSSNFSLLQSVTQSLSGRAALFTLLPFSFPEILPVIGIESNWQVIQRGMYPGVVADNIPPYLFYRNYYNTYVERDLRNLLKVKSIVAFDTFIRLLASRVGSEFNASSMSREVGVSSVTIAEWISVLETSYIVFPLRPHYNNFSKRLTKMPKYYFVDTGLLCFLLNIESVELLMKSPFKGSIFENMAICELLKRQCNTGHEPRISFYREASGAEVDAIMETPEGLEFYEMKSGETFHAEYAHNMKGLSSKFGNVVSSEVIYNGPTIPGIAINLRDV